MAGMLTSADKAWMQAVNLDAIADFGTTASIQRLIRNNTTGQMAPAAAHLTGIPMFITQARMADTSVEGAPLRDFYHGILNHLTVPTQIQVSDLVTAAGVTYSVVDVVDMPTHLELLLQHAVADLNTTS
jgi:hypothetical protein